ncbi:hypothetical protein, partial [Desulfopila aestuarii]
ALFSLCPPVVWFATMKQIVNDMKRWRLLSAYFYPGPWSGVRLEYFPKDWRGYKYLKFYLFNPGNKTISIEILIQDALNGQKGDKRFNDLCAWNVSVYPGSWTAVQVPLEEIHNIANSRGVDLARMTGIGFYVDNITELRSLYLDTVSLEKADMQIR